MNAITLEGITKRYGRTVALDNLSFTVPQGSVCALIGPNGAGKTTSMGLIAGLLAADAGRVDVLGQGPFRAADSSGRLGVMPQDSTPSQSLSIERSLRYYAALQGLDAQTARQEAQRWLEQVGLADRARSRYGALSHGMRRRFSVAQAFIGNPELVLLDEPTSGLDPELVVQMRDLITKQRGSSTVLVSSHILAELESMCDHAIFLQKGKCQRQGPMSALTGKASIVRIRLTAEPKIQEMTAALSGMDVSFQSGVLTARDSAGRKLDETIALCLRYLLDAGIGIEEVTSGDSLESAYLASRES